MTQELYCTPTPLLTFSMFFAPYVTHSGSWVVGFGRRCSFEFVEAELQRRNDHDLSETHIAFNIWVAYGTIEICALGPEPYPCTLHTFLPRALGMFGSCPHRTHKGFERPNLKLLHPVWVLEKIVPFFGPVYSTALLQ